MRGFRLLLTTVMFIGLVITSVGWYRSQHVGAEQNFEACYFQDETLILRYSYGANQSVAPRVDTRQRDIIVSLAVEAGKGMTPMIGMSGEARFTIFGGSRPVRYPDGRALPCPRRAPGNGPW